MQRIKKGFPAATFFCLALLLSSCSQQLASEGEGDIVLQPENVVSVSVRVAASSDDAEEPASGVVNMTSSALDLVYSYSNLSNQTVGVRFSALQVPKGATITKAYIQFGVKNTDSEATNLVIRGQAADAAPTFTTSSKNVSSRPKTAAAVEWSPSAWPTVNVAGAEQRTPDLSVVMQEIVNRTGWSAGNPLAFLITGSGRRRAWTYDGSQAAAPLLYVEYQEGSTVQQPALTITKAGTGTGTVVGDGITCGSTCSTSYPSGTVVTLTANPDSDSTFAGWSGACGGTGSCTVTMDSDKTVGATFSLLNSGGEGITALSQMAHFLTGCLPGTNCEPENQRVVPSTDPAGLAFNKHTGRLFIADSEIEELAPPRDSIDSFQHVKATIFATSLTGVKLFTKWNASVKTTSEPVNKEPTGITFCSQDGHFFASNDDTKLIYHYTYTDTALKAVDWISTSGRADDPEDLTCDPATGRIYVINGKGIGIGVFRYNNGFVYEKSIDLVKSAGTPSGVPSDPEGIVFDEVTGNLLVVSTPDMAVFEYTADGVFVRKYDISRFSPAPIAPQGLAIGPRSADSSKQSLYIADGGLDNNDVPSERDGVIYEAGISR